MSNKAPPDFEQLLTDDIIKKIQGQSKKFESDGEILCDEKKRLECVVKHGPQAVDNKILISISNTINDMTQSIKEGESQKRVARKTYMRFFQGILICALVFVGTLIILNASETVGLSVSSEVFISAIVVILADIAAIMHSFVKYMNNVEHYEVYNKLIDSLLKHLNHGEKK